MSIGLKAQSTDTSYRLAKILPRCTCHSNSDTLLHCIRWIPTFRSFLRRIHRYSAARHRRCHASWDIIIHNCTRAFRSKLSAHNVEHPNHRTHWLSHIRRTERRQTMQRSSLHEIIDTDSTCRMFRASYSYRENRCAKWKLTLMHVHIDPPSQYSNSIGSPHAPRHRRESKPQKPIRYHHSDIFHTYAAQVDQKYVVFGNRVSFHRPYWYSRRNQNDRRNVQWKLRRVEHIHSTKARKWCRDSSSKLALHYDAVYQNELNYFSRYRPRTFSPPLWNMPTHR